MLLAVYLQLKRAESWIELERLFPSTLLSGHLKTHIDPRLWCELGLGPAGVEGQAGMPHWTAMIKEKMAKKKENNDIAGRGGFGRQRNKSGCVAEG